MEENNFKETQVFRVRFLGLAFGLFFCVLLGFGALELISQKLSSLSASQNGQGADGLWTLCVVVFWIVFGLAFEWFFLSQMTLTIIVSPQGLRLVSALPVLPNLLLLRRKKGPDGLCEPIPWNQIRKIDYDTGGRTDSLTIDDGTMPSVTISSPHRYYHLKKLFPALRQYLPLSKFSMDARKLMAAKIEKGTDALSCTQDQMETRSVKELKKLLADNPGDERIKRALFLRYTREEAYIKKKYATEATALGKELLRAAPKDPALLLAMGNTLLWLAEDTSSAVEYYEKSVEAAPEDGLAYKKLLACYCLDKKFEKAGKLLERYQATGIEFISEKDLAFIRKVVSAGKVGRGDEDELNIFGSDDWPED